MPKLAFYILRENGQNTRKLPKNTNKTDRNCKEMAKISLKSSKLFTN